MTAPALMPVETLDDAKAAEWFTASPFKLDIGAGSQPRGEDYIMLDQFAPAHIQAPMWAIPLPDGHVDEIWSSHALEHVACAKVSQTLKEWFRVLKPQGRAIVQVPNFDYVARYWLTGPDRAWAEQMVYGTQAHDGEFHKAAYTAPTLKGDLEAAGFTVERVEYRWSHNQETLQAVAVKP
jgi:predicted SAM-dependent methyltransferase